MYRDPLDYAFTTLIWLVCIGLACLIGYGVHEAFFSTTECKTYSELRTHQGFVPVGKVMVPTTYQSRDCLVYGDKETK